MALRDEDADQPPVLLGRANDLDRGSFRNERGANRLLSPGMCRIELELSNSGGVTSKAKLVPLATWGAPHTGPPGAQKIVSECRECSASVNVGLQGLAAFPRKMPGSEGG